MEPLLTDDVAVVTGGSSGRAIALAFARAGADVVAAKLGPEGVRENAVHPGPVETAMTTDDVPLVGTEEGEAMLDAIPSRRFGRSGDVADAALFLASDLSGYVNGESLVVDGGTTSSG